MVTRLDSKIKTASVVVPNKVAAPEAESNVVQMMHEAYERPEQLQGATIKIKNGLTEHAMYLTVNHIVLNKGTKHEVIRPFEVFLNTKDAESHAYITTITRLLSAVWRKGGDFTFVIEELKSIRDVRGGCFLPGGAFINSLMHHVGLVLEEHLYEIGALKRSTLAEEVRQMVEQKTEEAHASGAFANAKECPKCQAMKYVVLDGCATCLECGYSKCG